MGRIVTNNAWTGQPAGGSMDISALSEATSGASSRNVEIIVVMGPLGIEGRGNFVIVKIRKMD